MAQSFSNASFANFLGQPGDVPSAICLPLTKDPSIIRLDMDFNIYWTPVALYFPPDSSCVALLHFDGVNGGVAFPDSSILGNVWTPTAPAQTATAVAKFGTASGSFDGLTAALKTPDNSKFTLGANEFCIEQFFNCTAPLGPDRYMSGQTDAGFTGAGSAWDFGRLGSGAIRFEWEIGGNFFSIQSASLFSNLLRPGFHHAAAYRLANIMYLAIDGVIEASAPITGAINDSAASIGYGCNGDFPGSLWLGNIDEARITIGRSVYPAENFVPPVQAFGSVTANSTLCLNVNLKGNTPQSRRLDAIRSIKIDNTGNSVPIYVRFNDTRDVITAPPFTSVWMPAITNGMEFQVFATGLTFGFIPNVKIFVANFVVNPNVDPEIQKVFPQYLGSPIVQRTNTLTPGFGPPALGDQVKNGFFGANNSGGAPQQATILPASTTLTNFYYLTAMSINVNQINATNSSGGSIPTVFEFRIYDQTANVDIFRWRSFTPGVSAAGANSIALNLPIINISNQNLRLNAGHSYGIQIVSVTPSSGVLTFWGLDTTTWLAYTENAQ